MDPPIPPKSPVLECILQDPEDEDANRGQISFDKSGAQKNEKSENEEMESTPNFAPTTTPIVTPAPTLTPAQAPTSTPTPVPIPSPTPAAPPVPMAGKVSRLQQVRQGIVHPQVGFFVSNILLLCIGERRSEQSTFYLIFKRIQSNILFGYYEHFFLLTVIDLKVYC